MKMGGGREMERVKKYWDHARSVQDTDQTQQQRGKKKQPQNLCETKAKRTKYLKPHKY